MAKQVRPLGSRGRVHKAGLLQGLRRLRPTTASHTAQRSQKGKRGQYEHIVGQDQDCRSRSRRQGEQDQETPTPDLLSDERDKKREKRTTRYSKAEERPYLHKAETQLAQVHGEQDGYRPLCEGPH